MKKTINILISIAVLLTFFNINITSAKNYYYKQNLPYEKYILLNASKKMKNMNIEELQNIIDDTKMKTNMSRGSISNFITSPIKLAWLAAAEIARKKGYPLSAKLVEHSIFDISYNEYNGDFAKAIKNTTLYNKIKNKNGSNIFTKKINSDLFYSIHKFSHYKIYKPKKGIIILDIFDFKLDYKTGDLFSSLVNNWAFLSQCTGVLNPINVSIKIPE